LLFQLNEYISSPFTINDGIFGSTFFMATGLHGMHVLVGITALVFCLSKRISLFELRNLNSAFDSKLNYDYYWSHTVAFESSVWY
jgi:cytochrome c oxidase subunit 3